MKINITPEQEAALRSGKKVTIDASALPPRVTVYINNWGRRTYKTTEALRVYRKEPNSMFFAGNSHPIRLGTDYKVYPSLLTSDMLRENELLLKGSENGRELRRLGMKLNPLNSLCIQLKCKNIVLDEPLLALTHDQLVEFLLTVAAHAPNTIHVYQSLSEMAISDMTKYLTRMLPDIDFDFVVNTRSSPSDVVRAMEAVCD
jgi:hypothetical protein